MQAHFSKSQPLRAALYVRCSTSKQEDSPDRQRSQAIPYLEGQGYVLAGEYVDDGIAGDEFERRPDFQRLLRDARARKFDVLVADELSRISRQEIVDFIATVVHPLKQAGVSMDTAADGPLGWDDVVKIITLAIKQDKGAGESKGLSRRVLTGNANGARAGKWLGGTAPYGYRLRYEARVIDGRPKMVPVRLEPVEEQARIVRWLFEQYAFRAVSLEDLTGELNARGVPTPGRKNKRTKERKWIRATVKIILSNPAYVGCLAWNKTSQGKYHQLIGGKAEKKCPGPKSRHDRAEWIVTERTHEPLVDQEIFDLVQDRLRRNRSGQHATVKRGYLLSRLLVCAHCGRSLVGAHRYGKVVYRCKAKDEGGRLVCGIRQVYQDTILKVLEAELQKAFLSADHLHTLRETLRRQVAAEQAPANVERLRRQVADLGEKIDQAHRNLAILPQDVIPGVVDQVRKMAAEKAALEAELKEILATDRVAQLEAEIAATEELLWRFQEARQLGDEALLREVICGLVERVELEWVHSMSKTGTRNRYGEPVGGWIIPKLGEVTPVYVGQPR